MNQSIDTYHIQNFSIGNQSVPFNITRNHTEQLVTLIATISISTICCVSGTITNIIVLHILRKKGKQRTVFDLTIASLCITDLLTCLSGNAYALYQLILHLFLNSSHDDTTASSIKSTILKIISFFFFLSLLHVLLITFQRFFAIFWSIKYRQVMTKSLNKKLIAMTWIILLISWPVITIVFNLKRFNPINGVIILTLGAIVSSMYIMMTVKICLRKKQFHWKAEHRALLNSIGVTISYFVCLSPYAYSTLIKGNVSAKEYDLTTTITLLNFVLDPLFYFYFSFWLNRRDEKRRNNTS